MRVLIVTWLYEPHATPRAIRWKTVARELVKLGCEVDVITSRSAGESAFEIVAGVNVHRCGSSAGLQLAALAKGSHSERPHVRLLKQLHRLTWKKLYWPDKACLWAWPAVRTAARLLRTNAYSGLITVSLPFTAHLAGFHIHRKYPNLPWLADVGDPFSCQDSSAPNNIHLHGSRNRRWERKLFSRAGRIAVTNESMAAVYSEMFPDHSKKLDVIPPVLGADVPRCAAVTASHPKKRLLFLGTLYKNIRNPSYLFSAFEILANRHPGQYELHMAGDMNDCAEQVATWESRIPGGIKVYNSQPRPEAMRMLAEADVLVNIGNTTPFQLPSKLVEYAAMGKHILNLSSCELDSSALFLKPYPGALTIQQTASPTDRDVEQLRSFIDHPPQVRRDQVDSWLHQFSAREVACSYLSALGLDTKLRRAA